MPEPHIKLKRVYQPAFTEPLAEGSEFWVMDRHEGWLLIQVSGAQEGWVPAADVVVF